jgi:hypothetical protein
MEVSNYPFNFRQVNPVPERLNLTVAAANIIEKPVFILTKDIACLKPPLFGYLSGLKTFLVSFSSRQ